MVSPPWKHTFAPPPSRIEMRAVVRYCAVDASIPVLSAKLVFVNAAACTPLTVCVCVACARHDAAATVWVWTSGRTSRSVSQAAARTSTASRSRVINYSKSQGWLRYAG